MAPIFASFSCATRLSSASARCISSALPLLFTRLYPLLFVEFCFFLIKHFFLCPGGHCNCLFIFLRKQIFSPIVFDFRGVLRPCNRFNNRNNLFGGCNTVSYTHLTLPT